nr:NAD(P)-binding domain-containing protein [Actinomadura litoris]
MMHTDAPVTVLGLGLMGGALAGAFLRAGHPTTVWNRTTAKADDLVARGATLAGSPAAAIAAAPLVVVCVSDYDAAADALDGPLDGRVVVNLTSGTPSRARALAEEVARRGGGYLDGGVMAVPEAVGTAEAVLAYSGPRSLYEAHASTLGSLGTGLHFGEDPGLSATHEMATLVLMWGMLNGFLNGAAILGATGVSASAYLPIAQTAIGMGGRLVAGVRDAGRRRHLPGRRRHRRHPPGGDGARGRGERVARRQRRGAEAGQGIGRASGDRRSRRQRVRGAGGAVPQAMSREAAAGITHLTALGEGQAPVPPFGVMHQPPLWEGGAHAETL